MSTISHSPVLETCLLNREEINNCLAYINSDAFVYSVASCPFSKDKKEIAFATGDWFFDELLVEKQPHIEAILNTALLPTYSFLRSYAPNSVLPPHLDIPACEVTVTINLEHTGSKNILYVETETETRQIQQSPGEAVIYNGYRYLHWRDPFSADQSSVQLMLHYVKADGPNTAFKFRQRPSLGIRL